MTGTTGAAAYPGSPQGSGTTQLGYESIHRTGRGGWWRPLVGVLLLAVCFYVAGALVAFSRARATRERALTLHGSPARSAPLQLTGRGGRPGGDLLPAAMTAVVVGVLLLAPMLTLLLRSLRTPAGWGLGNYWALGSTGGDNALTVSVWQATANSLRIAVDATMIAVLMGVLVALVVSRRPRSTAGRRASAWLDAAVMLPLGVSAVTVGFGFLIALNQPPLDLRSSPVLIPIAQAIVAMPLVVRTVLPVLRAIDPRQRQVAAVLGATPWRVLATVDGPYLIRSLGWRSDSPSRSRWGSSVPPASCPARTGPRCRWWCSG